MKRSLKLTQAKAHKDHIKDDDELRRAVQRQKIEAKYRFKHAIQESTEILQHEQSHSR